MPNKWTVSNSLMGIAAFFTALALINDNIYLFGMNRIFFMQGEYHYWIMQMFTSQFLHGDIMHFTANAIFILYFGNVLERIIGSQRMLIFFILCAVFLGILITFIGGGNTVGISGFSMAVITYYTLFLWKRGDSEYQGGVTAIVINILIGLIPGISFLGHFGGMVFGLLYWFLSQKKK